MGCWGCPWGLTRQIACRPWQRVVASVQGSFLLRSRRWSHAHMGCPLECPYGTLAMKHVWVRAPGSTAFGICRTRGRICSLHFLSFTWREAVSWCYLRKVCSGDRFCSCLSFWCSLLSHMEGLLVFLVLYLFFSFSCRIELTLLPHTVCETYRCVQAFHLEGMPGSHSSRETGRSLCRTKAGISCHWIGVELSPFWAASASPETSLDDAPSLTASFPSEGAGEPRVSQGVCGEGRAECSNRPCVLCLSLPWNRLSAPQWHLQCTRLPCPARLTGEVTAIWGLYLFSSVSLLCGGPVLGSVCHCRRDRKTVSPHHEPVSYENFKHA